MSKFITSEQADALMAYAREHGRTWKSQLLDDWMNGRCSGPLQHLRNIGGPTWLKSVRCNPERTSIESAELP